MLRKPKSPWVLYETEVSHSRFCDPAAGDGPSERLSPEHLQLLRDAFTCQRDRMETQKNRRRQRNREGRQRHGMPFEEFREVLQSVVGPEVEVDWAERFFSEVDVCCTGHITWQQLCSYLLLEYTERQRASVPRAAVLASPPQVRHCSHNKREPTVRVVAVDQPPPLRYISVSKGGQITIWSSSLHVLKTAGLAGDPTDEVASTRSFRGWTTDAVYMGNVQTVAIATNCRDLHFVRVTPASVFEDLQLYGFRGVLTALCYWHDTQCPERPPLLLLGDEKGGVHLMSFLNPSKGLFMKHTSTDKHPQRIFVPDIGKHHKSVSYRHIPNVHQEPINRLMFDPNTNVIMSSSETDTATVVFMTMYRMQDPHIWRIKQGCKCFDYNSSLQLMVTGGCDRVVRLWTRFVTTHPVAVLPGHRAAVLDVAIYQPARQIFSYSRDSELRVWDISSHQCLKAVILHFPCEQPGPVPEHSRFPFLLLSAPLPEDTQPHLVVGCRDYLALVHLADEEKFQGGWLMDEGRERGVSAVSCALFNATLKQVVTGHVNSSVSLWDVETGKRRLHISNAHGEEEITCMTLDSSHRRLISGARNGTIKVWSLLNGLNLHKLEPVTNSDVTGVTCLRGNRLLAVGWSQKIAQYDIACAEDLYVRADMSWKSSSVRKSDILAVCQCACLGVVATASYDGEVTVWKLDTQGPLLHLRTEMHAGRTPPVDALLFLQHRASSRKLRNRGVLVSSQAGCLYFWSVTGRTHRYGQFSAAEQAGERVLSLSSDQHQNSILVSGDTAGWLRIWDISQFALDIQHEAPCEAPPSLQRWRADQMGLLSVDVLELADRQFLLTASADSSARLWTRRGHPVGSFGQEGVWSITLPAPNEK